MKVRDVMTYGVISVPESASIAEAIETMLRSRVSALVVFDADHALSGILSEGDLLRRSELGSETKRPYWLELLIGSGRTRGRLRPRARREGRRSDDARCPDDRRGFGAQRGGRPDDPPPRQAAAGAARRDARRNRLALRSSQRPVGRDALDQRPAFGRRYQGRDPGGARQARMGAPRERRRRGSERNRDLHGFDHRRKAARRAQGHRREHAGLRRRPRPHGLDRTQFGRRHSV